MGALAGEVVLVTGGASGLGRAIVERCLEDGARVCVLDRTPERLGGLTGDIEVIGGDVRSFTDNEQAVEACLHRFGKLDCAIGNAGIWDYSTSLDALPAERIDAAFDELFHVNVKGYLNLAKAALPALVRSAGSLVFTVSNAGFDPAGGGPLYTASKHAAVGLIRQLAYELAPKVRVNGVAPCGMASDLRGPESLGQQDLRIMDSRTPDAIRSILPLQFFPEPADFTGPFVMLASRADNRTLSGVLINADAGLAIRGIRHVAGGLDL